MLIGNATALYFFKHIVGKTFGCGTGRNVAQHTQVDRARRDGKGGGKLADLTCGQLVTDEFPRDARNAKADLGKIDKKTARAELDLGGELDAALQEELFKVGARGGFFLQQNERKGGDLLGRVGSGKVAGIVGRGDKAGMRFKAGHRSEERR